MEDQTTECKISAENTKVFFLSDVILLVTYFFFFSMNTRFYSSSGKCLHHRGTLPSSLLGNWRESWGLGCCRGSKSGGGSRVLSGNSGIVGEVRKGHLGVIGEFGGCGEVGSGNSGVVGEASGRGKSGVVWKFG